MRTLQRTYEPRTLPDGTRALVVGYMPPEDAPPLIREGLARRAIVNSGGTCPCGAAATLPNRAERRRAQREGHVIRAEVEHEAGCPAADETLRAALREAGWSA